MKDCEIYSSLKAPCTSRIVMRADGRSFSSLANNLELKKPYDQAFVGAIAAAGMDFFKEFAPRFIYTFSDEVNILLADLPFSGRIEKMNSVFASFLSSSLITHLLNNNKFRDKMDNLKPLSFDSRVIPLDNKKTVDYFKSRQDEAWRNCLNGYAYWKLRKNHSKEEAVDILNKKKSQDLHELLYHEHINIGEVPSWQRRGVAIYREKIQVEGYNPVRKEKLKTERSRPFIDWNLPLFDFEFFETKGIF